MGYLNGKHFHGFTKIPDASKWSRIAPYWQCECGLLRTKQGKDIPASNSVR